MQIMRKLAPLLIGVAAGAGAMGLYLAATDAGTRPGLNMPRALEGVVRLAGGRDGGESAEQLSVAERLSAYRAAQDEGDAGRLQARLSEAAAQPASTARDVEIDALLARLAELAPARAASTAAALELDSYFIADAFLLWADTAPEAALDALAGIDHAALRRDIALTLIEVFGDDLRGIERIAAALPASDRDALTLDWLERRAEYDPYGALREATSLSAPALEQRALSRVAVAWAAQDPAGALLQADRLSGQSARSFRSAVYGEWARLDSAAFADHIATLAIPPDEISSGLQYLLASDPERALQTFDGMPGILGDAMRQTAMAALAERDPDAALARFATLPPGSERELTANAIASALARKDPDAALSWVESLEPASPDAMRSVLLGIAQTDFGRALDLLDRPSLRAEGSLILSLASSLAARDTAQAEDIADRLLERGDLQSRAALQNLVGNWMQRAPEAALDWVLANGTEIDPGMLSDAAQSMARQNPVAAAAFVERLPERYRASWVAQVAGQYARYDVDGAMAWLGRYQGQDVYDIAYRQVVTSAAQADPQAAANLLLQASAEIQRSTAATVASGLARTDPRTAANWALDFSDPATRSGAVASALGVWAASDAQSARSWTLNLRAGETRDQALTSLMQRSASVGDFDADLLRAFDSDSQRQQALRVSIPMLARRDPAQARAVLEREVPDANLRRQLEAQIEQVSQIASQTGVFF